LPKIDVGDQAIGRRMRLVQFLNKYVPPEKFNKRDPSHRLIDLDLKTKMTTKPVLEQFLTWLVHGSVMWYADGLGDPPEAMAKAIDEYYSENDLLGTFIRENCEMNPEYYVPVSTFKSAFSHTMEVHMSPNKLGSQMKAKGFEKVRKCIRSENIWWFRGLRMIESSSEKTSEDHSAF
jgi:phage/plasmid-associated DNA primase